MDKKQVVFDAVGQLIKGGVILCPTDSLWGLSCDATNEVAINKILKIKNRDASKGFTILLSSDAMVNNCVKEIPGIVWDLMDLSNEPLSIVMDGGLYVAKNALHPNGSISFRLIKSGICFEILNKFRKPIISTSANLFGETEAIYFDQINESIKSAIDFIVPENLGTDMSKKPSKMIKIKENGEITILRK